MSSKNMDLKVTFSAKLWNGPGWDKVGIEFTGSLKEILNKKLQTKGLHVILD